MKITNEILEENVNFWENRYGENNIGWHIDEINPQLMKYMSLLVGEEGQSKKFFLPLFGKTKDIPYLLSLGHYVFGVEVVRSAIEKLDVENSLDLQFNESESLYYTEDKRLQIYCGDFFTCPIEKWGPFDCVFDRGSFIAIDYILREPYIEVMKRSVGVGSTHKYNYLLQSVRYDKNKFGGPPKSVTEEDLEIFYKNWAQVIQLEKNVIPEDHPMRKVSGKVETDFYEVFVNIRNKD